METNTFHKLVAKKFHNKAKESNTNILERELAHRIMYANCRIPITSHNDFLNEMIKFKLIKIKNKRKIEVLK